MLILYSENSTLASLYELLGLGRKFSRSGHKKMDHGCLRFVVTFDHAECVVAKQIHCV